MGLFDFLKVTVKEKAAPKPAQRPVSVVEFDGKSFPLLSLTTKGFVARGFDNSLIAGQNARVSVRVDDGGTKFSFVATVSVVEAKGGSLAATWSILPTEVDSAIRHYAQQRKQQDSKGGGR
ncbi:hypothetical protein [Azospirillum picis]|uniref:PilZ domain-containing protein n=1 Tax=Azospirillum picis TaxID=488438 RepID=A0ABU0MEA1_9PROT|nr:hypothetical protein [Azospirillum picis]MBP2297924.1 hypothetical protein [Azospirillum picis]MDQ0531762.1 hypothetical protein [Azospirillum picis]